MHAFMFWCGLMGPNTRPYLFWSGMGADWTRISAVGAAIALYVHNHRFRTGMSRKDYVPDPTRERRKVRR